MRQFHKAGVALLAGLAGLALSGVGAAADDRENAPQNAEPQRNEGTRERQENTKAQQGAPRGAQPEYKGAQEGKPKGFGAGVGGTSFNLGPIDTAAACPGQGQSYGAGVGPSGEAQGAGATEQQGRAAAAPVPQYWLADASLFVANAGNAAQTLANEQGLGVQSPAVLGNQAQFLLASTDRAISSLAALQANAEATNPHAVADIRAAMDQLNAAKGQAQQAVDATSAGTFGTGHQAAIRSTYEHLQAAERQMATIGRAYGAPGFTLAMSRVFIPRGRGMGAGIGGGKAVPCEPKAPENKAPEKAAPAPEKPAEPGTEKP